jgi:F0F1-type ATP synthase assembly protein I
MFLASIISIGNMVVLWRSWQIRKSPAARWRMRPLSSQERRRIIITVVLCVATLAFVAAEIYSHHVLHPGEL